MVFAKIFYNRLLMESISYNEIDEKYQEKVKALGVIGVGDGKITPARYEELFGEECPVKLEDEEVEDEVINDIEE